MLRSNIKSLSVEGVGLKSLSDKRVRVSDKFLRLRLRPTRRSKASSANKNGKYTRQAGDGYEVLMYDGIRSTTNRLLTHRAWRDHHDACTDGQRRMPKVCGHTHVKKYMEEHAAQKILDNTLSSCSFPSPSWFAFLRRFSTLE